MRNFISEFLKKNGYEHQAANALLGAYDALKDNRTFHSLLNAFYKDETLQVDSDGSPLDILCREASVNFYTAKLLFYICLTEELHNNYKENGISEDMYFAAVEDLHCKMMECFDMYGVWGISSKGWFPSVFRMKTFGMGRFFYNMGIYTGETFFVGGQSVKKGDKYISIHIPSSKKPFDLESRLASYELAYNFYKKSFEGKEPLFRCESWLLNPANKSLLEKKSNIVSFMNDFNIVDSYLYPDNRSMWRVFGSFHNLPADKLPRDTSLQRAYADYIADGNLLGAGIGYFVYDPINKVTLK